MYLLIILGVLVFGGGWLVMPRKVAQSFLGILMVVIGLQLIILGFAIPRFLGI